MLAKDAVLAAAADKVAGNAQLASEALEQAGRGILKVARQLATGVPKGDELHYLIVVQGYVNEAAFALSVLATEAVAPETTAPKIEVAG